MSHIYSVVTMFIISIKLNSSLYTKRSSTVIEVSLYLQSKFTQPKRDNTYKKVVQGKGLIDHVNVQSCLKLFTNIKQSACNTLEGVVNNQSDFN